MTVDANALGPFQRHSDTSRQAALDNYARSGTQRRRVYDAIAAASGHGMTRPELALHLDLSENAVRPRVVELLQAELIHEIDDSRPTATGSQATILCAGPPPQPEPDPPAPTIEPDDPQQPHLW